MAHLFPTRRVVAGFGEITADNLHIITMGWITEGLILIFVGVLVAVVTLIDRTSPVTRAVYWTMFVGLNSMSVLSVFTGFKNSHFAFKLCPFIFTSSAILIIVSSYLE